jgi:hypothetical protein
MNSSALGDSHGDVIAHWTDGGYGGPLRATELLAPGTPPEATGPGGAGAPGGPGPIALNGGGTQPDIQRGISEAPPARPRLGTLSLTGPVGRPISDLARSYLDRASRANAQALRRSALLAKLVARGTAVVDLAIPGAGTLVVQIASPNIRGLAGRSSPAPTIVATGARRVKQAGRYPLVLRVTAAGRRLFAGHNLKRIKVLPHVFFTAG